MPASCCLAASRTLSTALKRLPRTLPSPRTDGGGRCGCGDYAPATAPLSRGGMAGAGRAFPGAPRTWLLRLWRHAATRHCAPLRCAFARPLADLPGNATSFAGSQRQQLRAWRLTLPYWPCCLHFWFAWSAACNLFLASVITWFS